jgi:cell division protein FtsB
MSEAIEKALTHLTKAHPGDGDDMGCCYVCNQSDEIRQALLAARSELAKASAALQEAKEEIETLKQLWGQCAADAIAYGEFQERQRRKIEKLEAENVELRTRNMDLVEIIYKDTLYCTKLQVVVKQMAEAASRYRSLASWPGEAEAREALDDALAAYNELEGRK